MFAVAVEDQYTAVRLKDLDYEVTEIRVFLRDSDENATKVATDTSTHAKGSDVTLHFTAPSPDTYDVTVKADVASGDTRTLFQDGNALRVIPDYSS